MAPGAEGAVTKDRGPCDRKMRDWKRSLERGRGPVAAGQVACVGMARLPGRANTLHRLRLPARGRREVRGETKAGPGAGAIAAHVAHGAVPGLEPVLRGLPIAQAEERRSDGQVSAATLTPRPTFQVEEKQLEMVIRG